MGNTITVVSLLLVLGACGEVKGAGPDGETSVDAEVSADAPEAEPDAAIDGAPPMRTWALLAGNARSDRTGPSPVPAEPLVLYVPDGAGFRVAWQSTERDWARAIAWGDYDGDGDQDFAVGNGFGSARRNRVYANEGGTFAVAWTAPTAVYSSSVEWVDLEGDGKLDLLAGGTNALRVYRNRGEGRLEEFELISHVNSSVSAFATADYDANGTVDVAIGWSDGCRVYANNGAGIFAERWATSSGAGCNAIAWGDYDGDGDQDLAADIGAEGWHVYRLGGGTFVDAFDSHADLTPPLTLTATTHLAWFDYDRDGDLDIAASHYKTASSTPGPDAVRVYRNSGGSFSVAWESVPGPHYTRGIAVGDYDGDGDDDIAEAAEGAERVHLNTGGSFVTSWTSATSDITETVAWGAL
jgi:hypothetical protein